MIAAGAQLKSADVCRVELHVVAAAAAVVMGGLKTARRWLEREEEEEEGIGNTTWASGSLMNSFSKPARSVAVPYPSCARAAGT